MNLNNFTIKSQEAIQQAQQLAFNNQNPVIETEHLLKSLLKEEDSPIEYLLKKITLILILCCLNLMKVSINFLKFRVVSQHKRSAVN
ncbi:MAG: Clp protease N-terminal domain-containing protein [Segetibacter sp.]